MPAAYRIPTGPSDVPSHEMYDFSSPFPPHSFSALLISIFLRSTVNPAVPDCKSGHLLPGSLTYRICSLTETAVPARNQIVTL